MQLIDKQLLPFVDAQGRIVCMPCKQKARKRVLGHLAEKFEAGRDYTEKEVNALCDAWHLFGDYFLLRRELVDHGFLLRERDGSRYWKNPAAPAPKEAMQ